MVKSLQCIGSFISSLAFPSPALLMMYGMCLEILTADLLPVKGN